MKLRNGVPCITRNTSVFCGKSCRYFTNFAVITSTLAHFCVLQGRAAISRHIAVYQEMHIAKCAKSRRYVFDHNSINYYSFDLQLLLCIVHIY